MSLSRSTSTRRAWPTPWRKPASPRRRTAVIWEGVTNYLTEEAVDATLRDLTNTTAHGSTIILTYVDRAALDNDTEWHRTVAKVGEPWTFGLHPADVAGYLAARGLDLQGDLSTKDVPPRRAGRRVLPSRLGGGPLMPKVGEEHLANRRRQILDAAANCFARNGFHRTSMQDIVKPRIRDLARQGVDDQRRSFEGTVPDGMIRVLVAIYQGLLLQASWDDDLDADAFVASVRELVERRT